MVSAISVVWRPSNPTVATVALEFWTAVLIVAHLMIELAPKMWLHEAGRDQLGLMVLWWRKMVLLVLWGMLLGTLLVSTEGIGHQGQMSDICWCGLIIERHWQSYLLLRCWLR